MNIKLYFRKNPIHARIFYCIIAILVGFILAYFCNYKVVRGGYKLQELVLLFKGACYHIHHYISCSIIILAILFGRYIKNDNVLFIIIGLLVGCSLEDGLFKDWYLIKNNCHKKKLIKFMMNT